MITCYYQIKEFVYPDLPPLDIPGKEKQRQDDENINKAKYLSNAIYIRILNSIQFTSIFPYKGFDLRLHSSPFKILLMICIFVCVTKNT